MLSPAAQQAIKAALQAHWEEAVEYNLTDLEQDPTNIDSLNRLARAYTQLGHFKPARITYQKVLALDRYNAIAKKNLDKLNYVNHLSLPRPNHTIDSRNFLEEPGKTKAVKLTKVTDAKIINTLIPGQPVSLVPKTHSIIINTPAHIYLGTLPDDLSHRLIKLIRSGNKYEAFIRTAQKDTVSVIVRETFRSKRFLHTPSFPLGKNLDPHQSNTSVQ